MIRPLRVLHRRMWWVIAVVLVLITVLALN